MLPSENSDYVSTSISRAILSRLDRVHRRRKIGIYAGPPGIGKTVTLERFQAENPGRVAIATLLPGPKGGVGAVMAGHLMLKAIGAVVGGGWGDRAPSGRLDLMSELHHAICGWAEIPVGSQRRGGKVQDVPPLTMVFDEAQYISKDALEFLRHIFDAKTSHTPVKVSMFFIGNAEFSLAPLASGNNVFSDSFGDRCFEPETWSYDHVTDDDLRLVADHLCLIDADGLDFVLSHFSRRRDRSFRRLTELLDELDEESNGQSISRNHVAAVLGLA